MFFIEPIKSTTTQKTTKQASTIITTNKSGTYCSVFYIYGTNFFTI